MKTFVAVAFVAVFAIVLIEISMSDAQRRCPEKDKPSLNTTVVTCDEQPAPRPSRQCRQLCKNCYERDQLTRRKGCLVDGACTCLAKPEGQATTAQPPVEGEDDDEDDVNKW